MNTRTVQDRVLSTRTSREPTFWFLHNDGAAFWTTSRQTRKEDSTCRTKFAFIFFGIHQPLTLAKDICTS